jgi:hypothetical protein
MLVGSLVLLAGVVLSVAWFRPTSQRANWPIPVDDHLAFSAHGLIGTAFDRLGAPPTAVATQWLKAAAHARTEDEFEAAARGLAAAAARSEELDQLEATLCRIVAEGQLSSQFEAVQRAGIGCDSDRFIVAHVPEGSPIEYRTRPPTAGAHYPVPYSRYGVVEEPVSPGYWVHNLEHGTIVLLYRCPEGCPALVAQLRAFYVSLPLSPSARSGQARFLAIPYADMERRIAVLGWWRLLELDDLDEGRVREFYDKHVDRGPECQDRRCPE